MSGMGLQIPFGEDDRESSEMRLKMPSKEYDGESSEMGLKMPSKEHDRESSKMGLKMPSKVDVDFIKSLFVGILVPVVCEGVHWGVLIFVVFLFEENSVGNRV